MNEMPTTDLPGWRYIFGDDFTVDVPAGQFPAAVSTKWQAYPNPWKDSSGHGTYAPKIVSAALGLLDVFVHTEVGQGPLVAALMPRHPKTIYGRYAVRFRFDPMVGYKMAWLLWPNSNYQPDGEIDWPEMNLDSSNVQAFMHFARATGQTAMTDPFSGGWHTCIIEWSPGLVVYILDGVELGRTDLHIPTVAMHWVLQTETAMGGAPIPAADVAGHVQIDWVAVWKYDLTATGPPNPRALELTAPATAIGITTLATAVHSTAIRQVKWLLESVEIGWTDRAPFSVNVDTAKYPNGVHQIWTKALDTAWFDGSRQTMKIANPVLLQAAATATGIVRLSVQPYRWLRQVKWVLDGKEIGFSYGPDFTVQWDSTKVANGTHSLFAKVLGTAWEDGKAQTIAVAN